MIMKKNILFVWLSFLLSCSKNPTVEDSHPIVPADTDPSQYSTPYNNVPLSQDVTLYQVNMRVFSTSGNFKGVVARLDSIKALGINVVYLMPIYPVGILKAVNSPYCVQDYKAVNSEFGTLDDLRALVDNAHSKNMAVILDWVANHTSWDNGWINNRSWYQQDLTGNIISPPNTGWNDVAQLNFNNPDMRLAMIKAMKYWVLTANTDGFRCDYSDGPPTDFWKQAIDSLRNISTHKLLMLAEGTRSANYAAGFDYNFGFKFFDNLKTMFNNQGSVQLIDNLNVTEYTGASGDQQIVRYITNHDVNGSDGTPLELFGGVKGSMAAFVVVAYMKGVPMVYNGQEVGTSYRLPFPFTSKKIDWTTNPDVTAEYKKILTFRNNSAAIRRGQLLSYSNDDVCAFTKQQGNEKVLVIVNLRNKIVDYTLPAALANTLWSDAMNGGNTPLTTKVTLQPYTYLVLKSQ